MVLQHQGHIGAAGLSDALQLLRVCREPGLYLVEDFAASEEIEQILALAGDRNSLEERGIGWKHDETGFSFELPTHVDALLLGLNQRIYRLIGVDSDFDHSLRFRHYREGDYHPPHHDHFEIGNLVLLATAMLHLCDTDDGGETVFPDARPEAVSVTPKRGRLVIWLNHRADGSPDPRSLHEALPVRAGEKITLTNFLYKPREAARALARR